MNSEDFQPSLTRRNIATTLSLALKGGAKVSRRYVAKDKFKFIEQVSCEG